MLLRVPSSNYLHSMCRHAKCDSHKAINTSNYSCRVFRWYSVASPVSVRNCYATQCPPLVFMGRNKSPPKKPCCGKTYIVKKYRRDVSSLLRGNFKLSSSPCPGAAPVQVVPDNHKLRGLVLCDFRRSVPPDTVKRSSTIHDGFHTDVNKM